MEVGEPVTKTKEEIFEEQEKRKYPRWQLPTKHSASKPGHRHTQKAKPKRRQHSLDHMTNHERVVALRAFEMGISVEEYKKKFG